VIDHFDNYENLASIKNNHARQFTKMNKNNFEIFTNKIIDNITIIQPDMIDAIKKIIDGRFFEEKLSEQRLSRPGNDDHHEIALTLNNIGMNYIAMEKYEEALEKFNESLAIFHKLNDNSNYAKTSFYIGFSHLLSGEQQEALQHFKESQKMYKNVNDRNCRYLILMKVFIIKFSSNQY
jgi:tetratricopeptide (TPR) repeat protein